MHRRAGVARPLHMIFENTNVQFPNITMQQSIMCSRGNTAARLAKREGLQMPEYAGLCSAQGFRVLEIAGSSETDGAARFYNSVVGWLTRVLRLEELE